MENNLQKGCPIMFVLVMSNITFVAKFYCHIKAYIDVKN